MYKFNLKIYIFNLKMYKANLKMEFSQGIARFSGYMGRAFPSLWRQMVGGKGIKSPASRACQTSGCRTRNNYNPVFKNRFRMVLLIDFDLQLAAQGTQSVQRQCLHLIFSGIDVDGCQEGNPLPQAGSDIL